MSIPLRGGGGGEVGWREHYIQLAIQLETFDGGGGFHCNWRCVRITESGVRKVTDFPLHPHENKSPSRTQNQAFIPSEI